MIKGTKFEGIEAVYFFVGQVTAFANRLQTAGDGFFEEISWKQFFLLICLKMFETPPTIKELSDLVGSTHQNVKQLLLKLERAGFVQFVVDEADKRKQRILMTQKVKEFDDVYAEPSELFMKQLYRGVDMQKLQVTIETLMQLDDNLKKLDMKEIEN